MRTGISLPLTNGVSLGVMVLWPRHIGVQPHCPVGAQPCWQGEDELQASKCRVPLFSLQSCGLAGDPPARSRWLKEAVDFPAAEDRGSRLDAFLEGHISWILSLASYIRQRISCFQVTQGVGKVRAGSLVPASSGFEPSLPSLSWAYKLFPGRTAPWASNGARLARSSLVPGKGEAGADGLAGCCH